MPTVNRLRKLSKLEAELEVRNIALECAATNGIEGSEMVH